MSPEPSQLTTVLVADDHPMYREGIARAVGSCEDLELVGDAADGVEALSAIRRIAPDVAVIDLNMPGCDGLGLVRTLVAEMSATRVLILSVTVNEDTIYELISAGAAGYLSKEATRAEICTSISAVGRGETVFGRHAQTGLASAIRSRGQIASVGLTPREQEILEFAADGLNTAKIGERLHLSPATVKTHFGALYQKLDVSDRAAAVAVAMRLGLLR